LLVKRVDGGLIETAGGGVLGADGIKQNRIGGPGGDVAGKIGFQRGGEVIGQRGAGKQKRKRQGSGEAGCRGLASKCRGGTLPWG